MPKADEIDIVTRLRKTSALSEPGLIQDLMAEAAAELSRLRSITPDGWKPIESAPKDGTWVLLWWPYWSHHAIMAYFDGGSWSSEGVLSDHDEPGPTHWQPLPASPSPPVEDKV